MIQSNLSNFVLKWAGALTGLARQWSQPCWPGKPCGKGVFCSGIFISTGAVLLLLARAVSLYLCKSINLLYPAHVPQHWLKFLFLTSSHKSEQFKMVCHWSWVCPWLPTLNPGAGRCTQGRLGPPWHHARRSFALQPLPIREEPPAKTCQKPDECSNIQNFSSYRQNTSVHTFDVLVIFNWLLMHTGFDPSLLARVYTQWLKSHTISFFPCRNVIKQKESAQGDLHFLHGCCRGNLRTKAFLKQLSPINSLGSALEKPFVQCLGSLNWKSYK